MFDEAFRRQHRHPAGIDVGLGGGAQDAAEMVDVAVGGDHRDHGPVGRRDARYSVSAAAATSVDTSGSMTMMPVSVSTNVT